MLTFLNWNRVKTAAQVSAVIKEKKLTAAQRNAILKVVGKLPTGTTQLQIEFNVMA